MTATFVAAWPPNVTVAPDPNPAPVSVTGDPPDVSPIDGPIPRIVNVAAGCETMTRASPMTTVPVRGRVEGFANASSVTVPAPLPAAPAVTLTQGVKLVAVQLQPAEAPTAM